MTGGPDEFSRVNATLAMRNYLQGVCNKSQLNQALIQIGIDITEADKFPVGCIIWWTGRPESIPENWAIANGVDNALHPYGGSGLNLIGLFIRATHTNEDVGAVESATATSAPLTSHDHAGDVVGGGSRITIAPPAFTGPAHHALSFGLCEGQHLGPDCEAGTEDDPVWTFTLDEAGAEIGGEGKHSHDGSVLHPEGEGANAKKIEWEGENHNHGAILNDITIGAHARADVAGCIASHDNHTHGKGTGMFTANPALVNSGGDIIGAAVLAPRGGADWATAAVDLGTYPNAVAHQVAGADLTHNAHDHDDTINWSGANHEHFDITGGDPVLWGHSHTIDDVFMFNPTIEETSDHKHEDYKHSHEDITLDLGGGSAVIPGHTLPVAQHTHQVINEVARHGHEVAISPESSHTHTTGRPDNVSLIPIERMPN
jgi:hypothetical protein